MKQDKNPGFLAAFNTEDFKPLFVAASNIEKVIIGKSKQTWANWRSQKIGPKYYKINGSVYYKISDLEEYFSQYPIQTFNPE